MDPNSWGKKTINIKITSSISVGYEERLQKHIRLDTVCGTCVIDLLSQLIKRPVNQAAKLPARRAQFRFPLRFPPWVWRFSGALCVDPPIMYVACGSSLWSSLSVPRCEIGPSLLACPIRPSSSAPNYTLHLPLPATLAGLVLLLFCLHHQLEEPRRSIAALSFALISRHGVRFLC